MQRRHLFLSSAGLLATALHNPLQAQPPIGRGQTSLQGSKPLEKLEFDGWIVSRTDKLALLKLHLTRLQNAQPRDEDQILQTRQAIESLSPLKTR